MAAVKRQSELTIGTGAVVSGKKVEMTSFAGDVPVLTEIAKAMVGDDATASSAVTGMLQFAIDVASEFIPESPIAVVVKMAKADLNINASAEIEASGDIHIESNANADGQASAEAWHTATLAAGIGFSWSETTTNLGIGTNAKISAGGKIHIKSKGGASADAQVSYEVAEPGFDKNGVMQIPDPASKYRIITSIARTLQNLTTTVASGANITAGGEVAISSDVENTANNQAAMAKDKSGNEGSLIVNLSFTDVNAVTLISGNVTSNGSVVAEYSATFNPRRQSIHKPMKSPCQITH